MPAHGGGELGDGELQAEREQQQYDTDRRAGRDELPGRGRRHDAAVSQGQSRQQVQRDR